jgi:3D (Asp-Asp-Asp) domain-containing protein
LLSDFDESIVTPITTIVETPEIIETITPIVVPVTTQIPKSISTSTPTSIVNEYATIEGDVLTFADEFTITYYCPCKKCCGKYSYEVTGVMNTTASGTTPVAGRTIAVCPDQIPYGTTVIINGHEYIAEDCGGSIGWNKIDIYCDTHEAAIQGGRHKAVVSIKR